MRKGPKKMGGKGMAKRKPKPMAGPMAPPTAPMMMAGGGKVKGYAKGGMVKKGKC